MINKNTILKTTLQAVVLAGTLTTNHAQAGFWDEVGKAVNKSVENVVRAIPARVPASIDFRNSTDKPIRVVMDSNREEHSIAPKGQATFGKANVGDAPTFRVYDCNGDNCLFSRRVAMRTTLHSSFGWNGGDF